MFGVRSIPNTEQAPTRPTSDEMALGKPWIAET